MAGLGRWMHHGDMPRPLWTGAISFGLVNVPVALYPAAERHEFEFSMLDKRDLSPVGYKRVSKRTGREVKWSDVVKGYEYEKDRYVVLTDEDFKQANVKATQTIDIQAFVPAQEIPTQFYDTPYFLAPGKRGEKVYALLRETLRDTGRVAVAQVVIRTTPHLAVVYALDRALMLNTLRYAAELRDPAELPLPKAGLKASGVTAKEVELAKRLIDDMAHHWQPEAFKDSYHDDLMQRIREKIKRGQTKEISEPKRGEAEPRQTAEVIDLAELLKKSLKSEGGARKAAHSVPRKRKRA
jgi:DNA end-binding protein Ku